MTNRFETIFDEGDWILDNDTGEYLSIEEACGVLNDMYDECKVHEGFWKTFITELDKANGDV